MALGDALHREHALGGCGQRIAAQFHGHRAGVSGDAAQGDAQPGETVDCGDHADRKALGLEHRSLLDMELRVRDNVLLFSRERGYPAGSSPNSTRASRIDLPEASLARNALVEDTGDRAATEERGTEAHAFFVTEADNLDREGKALPAAFSA